MPLRIGMVLYPLLPVAFVLLKRGPVQSFLHAGAVSPATARRPLSVGAKGDLERAVRQGVLVRVEDGLYYIDLPTHRRLRRRLALFSCLATATAAVIAWWLWTIG